MLPGALCNDLPTKMHGSVCTAKHMCSTAPGSCVRCMPHTCRIAGSGLRFTSRTSKHTLLLLLLVVPPPLRLLPLLLPLLIDLLLQTEWLLS